MGLPDNRTRSRSADGVYVRGRGNHFVFHNLYLSHFSHEFGILVARTGFSAPVPVLILDRVFSILSVAGAFG